MKGIRFVIYAALGFVLSTVLILVLGDGGLLRYRALADYREDLSDNIRELERIHEDLLADLRALAGDPERVALQARQLGYFREGERLIRQEGYNPPRSVYTVGRIIRRLSSTRGRGTDRLFRLLGAAVVVCLVSLSAWRRRGYADRK